MSEATMNEMERLRRERDEASAERDALAAHVDRMERRGDQMAIELRDWLGSYGPDDDTERMLEVWEDAKSRRPDASLARLKAQWQTEALYEFTHGSYIMPATLNLADPIIDTCDLGHRFAKLPDHPTREGLPCCPHCMKEGLLKARAEVVMLRESLDDTMGKLVSATKKLAPETSLTRLKAEWQAEAAEEALRRMKGTCFAENRVEEYAEELRRQAEEDA